MKTIATIIFVLTLNYAFAQDTLLFGVTTPKNINGRITELRKVVHSGQLDFDFYKKHFFVPYYYPDQMVNLSHKNDSITVWNDTTKVGDFKANWSHTVIYDSQSRVTSYRYSGCMICSQLPYDYRFFYNDFGQVIKMTNNLNHNKTVEFKYDNVGDIVRIIVYRGLELIKEIELMKK